MPGALGHPRQGATARTPSATRPRRRVRSRLFGGNILLVVPFVAYYYCGGYVAGRMARFDGVNQVRAVWVWRWSSPSS